MALPAAPQKRLCLIPLDENSLGSNSSFNCNSNGGKRKEKGAYPLPTKRCRRLVDSTMSTALFNNLGLKPLPPSPTKAKSRRLSDTPFGFAMRANQSSSSSLNLSTSSLASSPEVVDLENESGFFESTPNSNVTRSSFCSQSSSNRPFGRSQSFFMISPNVEPYPTSFYMLNRQKLINAPKKEDYFSALPDEMILPILKWLPKNALGRMAQVSQRFNRVTHDESLWRRVDFLGKFISSEHINVLFSRKPVYLRLSRSKVAQPTGLGSDFSFPQLTFLDLSMAVISAATLTQILGMCTSLVKLSLEHLEVGHDALVAMKVFSHSIETLNLTMCYDLPYQPFVDFLNKCKKLKTLNIGNVKQNWTKDNLMLLISCLPVELKELNISGFRSTMVDTHVLILAERCTSLVTLDVSDCQELTMVALEAISTITGIENLGLSRCYSIETSSYSLLARMKALRHLEIFALLKESSIKTLESNLLGVRINNCPFSSIARPTFGFKRSSIWAQRVRD